MSGAWGSFLSVCAVLLSVELLGRLCPKNDMVRFTRSLAVLALLVSVVAGVFSLDWDFSGPARDPEQAGEELSGYVEESLRAAAEGEMESYLRGLLGAAGLEAEKIRLSTDIGEDGSIVLTKVTVLFSYRSDGERAQALLRNALGEEIQMEVQTDGR